MKGNSFQRKHELITTPFFLQQPFVCNLSSICLRTNFRVQNWNNILERMAQKLICLVKDSNGTFSKENLFWHMVTKMVKR